MKKQIALITSLLIMMILSACGPTPKPSTDEANRCRPRNLTVESVGNHAARIAWDPGCAGVRIMAGYQIYVQPVPALKEGQVTPVEELTPFNRELYPGAPDGNMTRDYFDIENIENATRYFVHVRALYGDNTLSAPTNEVEVVCFPSGSIDLAVSHTGDQDGFSFADDGYCDTDDLVNDIYYFNRDGQDFICSPTRLGPVNRNSKLYSGGEGKVLPELDKLRPQGDPADKIAVKEGDNIVLVTDEGYYVGLAVKGFKGNGEDRIVTLEYYYKPPIKEPSEKA